MKLSKKNKVQPKPIRKITCNNCKELLMKIYPYAVIVTKISMDCSKCLNKGIK